MNDVMKLFVLGQWKAQVFAWMVMTGCGLTACRHPQVADSQGALRSNSKTQVMTRVMDVDSSGILPLASGPEAFAARLALAGQAQHTLDLQYYIWKGDQTGKLLAGAVIRAAERGVKTRLLLDDMDTAAKDHSLLTIESQL